jgi:hypothetical protein
MTTRTGTPFRSRRDGMPDVGQGTGWKESEWRRAPTRRVRLADLIAVNRGGYLDEAIVARYVRSGGGGKPCVVEHRGCLYVADGHHRAVAAWRRGENHIKARVITV